MHVLLTGASGRIGSYILRLLLEQGHSVFAVDITHLPKDLLSSLPETHRTNVKQQTLDLADIQSVDALFEKEKFDGVIHFGAIPSPDRHDARVVHNNNVTGTYNVLWTAAHKGGVRRICQASSVNAVGMSFTPEDHWTLDYVPVDEEVPYRPMDPYSLSKQIIETQAAALCRELPDLRIASLRLSLCVDTYKEAATIANAKNLWSWSSKDSVARAALFALTSEGWSGAEVFNVVSPAITGGSLEEGGIATDPSEQSARALELLEHHRSGRVKRVEEGWWEDDPRRGFYDCTKAETMLGWKHDL